MRGKRAKALRRAAHSMAVGYCNESNNWPWFTKIKAVIYKKAKRHYTRAA